MSNPTEKNALYERIEQLINDQIHRVLSGCPEFKRLEWHGWPGTKPLSIAAADAVFAMLDAEQPKSVWQGCPDLQLGSIQVGEERLSPTREDRAYQVLCALLSSKRHIGDSYAESADVAYTLVDAMSERATQSDR